MEQINVRNRILTMLVQTLEQGMFSHVVLNNFFAENPLPSQERRFVSVLFGGTIENKIYLDHVINSFSKLPVVKMKPVIRNLLRMSVYQILFMDAVPDHAAVSEALKICRKRKLDGLKSFVNGVLGSVSRSKEQILNDREKLPVSVRYSMPEWICHKIEKQYGTDTLLAYVKAVDQKSRYTTVCAPMCRSEEEFDRLLMMFKQDGCEISLIEGLDRTLQITGFQSLPSLKAFREGKILVQDISSVLVAQVVADEDLDLAHPPLILDVCAAPGGKSLDLAGRFPQAEIIAMDLSETKTGRIEENTKRMGIRNISTRVHDARSECKDLIGQADLVICDLPCSGLGVTGRKPDIRYRLKEEDILSLAKLQREILAASASYVKPGGLLLYSTCTVTAEENAENADWFLEHYPFEPVSFEGLLPDSLMTEEQMQSSREGRVQLINGKNDADGFFIAKFRKK